MKIVYKDGETVRILIASIVVIENNIINANDKYHIKIEDVLRIEDWKEVIYMSDNRDIIDDLKALLNQIKVDTDNYLEKDIPMPNINIEYKGITVSIPTDLADTNDYIQGDIEEFIETFSDYFI